MEPKTIQLFDKKSVLGIDSGGNYTDIFREKAFIVWYTHGRPGLGDVIANLDMPEGFPIPAYTTLRAWRLADKWDERADEMDKKVRDEVEQRLVSEKAIMQAKHAEIGRKVYEKGITALEEIGIKTTNQALRAIELGIGLENDATNLEKLLSAVAKMEDPKIVAKTAQLLSKVKLKNEPDD